MYPLLFLLFLVLFCAILITVGIIPSKYVHDYNSPLNYFMYQEPNNKYSDQLVNLWVDKSWRSDGRRIPCRLESWYPESVETSRRNLVIYSHGQAEDLLTCTQFIRQLAGDMEMDVLAWDYSGYGLNDIDAFERTPEGINLTLQTIVDCAITNIGYQMDHIVFWGYSLGSGPSTHIVANLCKELTPPAGLVLFGAYTSILDVVKAKTHPEVVKLFSERWNNQKMIASITCPILLMHGQNDGMIEVSHANALHAANPNATKVILPNTGHVSFHWGEAIKEVDKWFKQHDIIVRQT